MIGTLIGCPAWPTPTFGDLGGCCGNVHHSLERLTDAWCAAHVESFVQLKVGESTMESVDYTPKRKSLIVYTHVYIY